jgi:hypothetical protein
LCALSHVSPSLFCGLVFDNVDLVVFLPHTKIQQRVVELVDNLVHTCIIKIRSSDLDIFVCFMCFWFGLEILRLVYKKVCFKILNSIIFDLLSSEKSNPAPYKS